MRRVIFNSYLTPSSVSAESETVIQRTYKAPFLKQKIIFAIGEFNHEANSAVNNTSILIISQKRTMSRILGLIMNEAREMIFEMEETFGKSLVDTDLYFFMVSGKNIFKADPFFAVIGTESPAYSSPLFLWKLVRESVVMKWFASTIGTSNEKMMVHGAISYLVESFVGVRRVENDEGWVSAALSEELRNALPLELYEGLSYEGIKTPFSVQSSKHVVEVMSNLIGKKTMSDTFNTFLLDVRQKGNSSLFKALENAFLQQEQKDWCSRPLNVTDFFIQWMEKPWPMSGVSITKLFLHISVNDRKGSLMSSSATIPSSSSYGNTDDYPPIPILVRSLEDGGESVIWQSRECGVVFSHSEDNVMALLNKSEAILRVGSPRQLRITYEESGPSAYPTVLSKIFSQRTKVSANEQLTFAADRLHFIL
ncbi:hypothetical protein AB6A40_008784 [Gnathostoma spinigerum]|uniref:Uncharacterized protein n=1 Tax=Gnathostoma spinigerum TaxID=75299 RepID=A0ABD6ERA6_9BILA